MLTKGPITKEFIAIDQGVYSKIPASEKGVKPRREGDKVNFIDIRLERGQVVRLRKGGKPSHSISSLKISRMC